MGFSLQCGVFWGWGSLYKHRRINLEKNLARFQPKTALRKYGQVIYCGRLSVLVTCTHNFLTLVFELHEIKCYDVLISLLSYAAMTPLHLHYMNVNCSSSKTWFTVEIILPGTG